MRKRVLVRSARLIGLSLAVAAGGLVVSPASQAEPEMSISEVQQRLHELEELAEQETERWLAVRVDLERAQQRQRQADVKLARSQDSVAELTKAAGGLAAAAYRSGGVDPTIALLLSEDASDFLSSASSLDALARRQSDILLRVLAARQQMAADQAVSDQRLAEVQAVAAELAERRRLLDERIADAESLLDSLREEQRAELARRQAAERAATVAEAERAAAAERGSRDRHSASPEPSANSSSRAARAVRYALAQVGKRYVYAAAGPDAFDCSGLTMMAYRAAGVSLPHQSGLQFAATQRVDRAALRPGDLVFYYTPISHVAIYIGGGRIVDAANPSSGVRIAPVFSMPFVGAGRV